MNRQAVQTFDSKNLTTIKGLKDTGKKFVEGFLEHDLMTLAAALAFYTALALAPLLLITLAVVGVMGDDAKNNLLVQIQQVLGAEAGQAVTAVVEAANKNPQSGGIAGVVGVIVLFFSASGVFAQLQASLNVIWKATGQISVGMWGWVKKRLLSMGMVLTLGFIAIVSLIVSTVLSSVFTNEGTIWNVINLFVSGAIFSFMFSLIFKYLPDAKLSWRDAGIGGVITAILFLIGKTLIGIYLGKSALGSSYGAAGSLIVLLAWVYYSSIIVFSGAELTRVLSGRK